MKVGVGASQKYKARGRDGMFSNSTKKKEKKAGVRVARPFRIKFKYQLMIEDSDGSETVSSYEEARVELVVVFPYTSTYCNQ